MSEKAAIDASFSRLRRAMNSDLTTPDPITKLSQMKATFQTCAKKYNLETHGERV